MFNSILHIYKHKVLDDTIFYCVADNHNDANGLLAIWISENELDVDPCEFEYSYSTLPIPVATIKDSEEIYKKVKEIRGF